MVRRGVLFAVCSVFLSMPSQNLLVDLSDQLFETRTWLAGKKKKTGSQCSSLSLCGESRAKHLFQFCYYRATFPKYLIQYLHMNKSIQCLYVTNNRLTLKHMILVNAQKVWGCTCIMWSCQGHTNSHGTHTCTAGLSISGKYCRWGTRMSCTTVHDVIGSATVGCLFIPPEDKSSFTLQWPDMELNDIFFSST